MGNTGSTCDNVLFHSPSGTNRVAGAVVACACISAELVVIKVVPCVVAQVMSDYVCHVGC
jgi:hypothetical protein